MSEIVAEELQSLLAWNPPVLSLYRPDSPRKQKAHDPRVIRSLFYDGHIAELLWCMRVVHVPDLHQRIADVVDQKLRTLKDQTLVPQPDVDICKADREDTIARHSTLVVDESALADYYHMFAEFFLPVASALVLQPTVMENLLSWVCMDMRGPLGSYGHGAHLDLKSFASTTGGLQNLMNEHTSTSELMQALQELGRQGTSLATWEFTRMTTQSIDAMLGVLLLSTSQCTQPLRWKTSSSLALSDLTDSYPHPNTYQGHDASEIADLIGDQLEVESVDSSNADPRVRLDESLRRNGSSIDAVSQDIYSAEVADSDEDVVRLWQEARERGDFDWEPPGENYEPSNMLLQQAWAQSVRQNTSVFILRSGNYEYVCLRHREKQTLYISDILHTPFLENPEYGKLLVGLYMVALQDTLHRHQLNATVETAAQSSTSKVAEQTMPRGQKRSGEDLNEREHKRRAIDGKTAIELIASWSTIHLCFRYGIYDSAAPEVYHRLPLTLGYDSDEDNNSDGSDASASDTQGEEDQVDEQAKAFRLRGIEARQPQPPVMVLNSHLGEGSTGNAHGGFLEMRNKTGSYRLQIVVKLAFDKEQKQRLQTEYNVYNTLMAQGVKGIPTALGLYHNPRKQSAPFCLITTFAGASLLSPDDSKEWYIRTITSEQRDTLLSILKNIHGAGVRHGDLFEYGRYRAGNITVNVEGELSIIDFSHAKKRASQSQLDDEYEEFRAILEKHVRDPVRASSPPSRLPARRSKTRPSRPLKPERTMETRSMARQRQESNQEPPTPSLPSQPTKRASTAGRPREPKNKPTRASARQRQNSNRELSAPSASSQRTKQSPPHPQNPKRMSKRSTARRR